MPFNSSGESLFANTLSFRKRVVIALSSEALAIAIVLITTSVLRHSPSLGGGVVFWAWSCSVIAAIIVLCLGIAISIGEK
jgi:hypothetical protein